METATAAAARVTSGHGGKRQGGVGHPKDQYVGLDVRTRLVIAKAEREEQMAALASLERKEREGKLVPSDAARKSLSRAGMAVRDAMLSLPGRYAAQLASMTDERAIDRLLTDVIRAELTRLADTVTADAA